MLRLRLPSRDDEAIWSLVEAELIPRSNLKWDVQQLKNDMPKRLSKGFTYVKVDLNNHLVGFVHAIVLKQVLVIDMLAVHASYQGKGIGKSMLLTAELQANQQSCTSASLVVDSGNDLAIRFYKQHDYHIKQYIPSLQCWELQKWLKP